MVVGALNLDRVLTVDALPDEGATIVASREDLVPGGKAANQAAAAAALGASVAIVGMVGDDSDGALCREALASSGVELAFLGSGIGRTGTATIAVDERGRNFIVLVAGANAELSEELARSGVEALVRPGGVVLASLEVPLPAVEAAAHAARRCSARFVLDPAPALELPASLLELCDVLVPNEGEVSKLGYSVRGLLEAGAGAVVVTLGERGVELVLAGGASEHVPAFAVDVVDTTGAGDAFAAALAVALVEQLPLLDACQLAVAAGSLATTGFGARGKLAARPELDALIAGLARPQSGAR